MYNPDYLLDNWINYFYEVTKSKGSFLENNLWRCLREFREFATFYEYTIERVASGKDTAETSDWLKDVAKESVWSKDVDNETDWLKEKVRQALDTYRAPLLQAAAQYASPPYKNYMDILLKTPSRSDLEALKEKYPDAKPAINNTPYLKFKTMRYLAAINSLLKLEGPSNMFTIDDVVVFFDEDTLIRRPPYTRKALISTPFQGFGAEKNKYVIDKSFDEAFNESLTGIAHEMGHDVYWRLMNIDSANSDEQSEFVSDIGKQLNAKVKNQAIAQYSDTEINLVKDWIEEMFADFIGAKIAERDGQGVNTFTETGKTLIKRRNKDSNTLVQNDYEHPPDILRPLVTMYVDALHNSGVNVKAAALKSWKDFFKNEPFSIPDPSTMSIKVVENNTGRSSAMVGVSVEKLSLAILDTIDLFVSKINENNLQTQLNPATRVTNDAIDWLKQVRGQMEVVVKKMVKRAENIYKEDNSRSVLELLLDPIVLEAGKNRHGHDVWHAQENKSYKLFHTH